MKVLKIGRKIPGIKKFISEIVFFNFNFLHRYFRDWSLITGRGGYKTGGGAREVLPLRKGGRKKF